MIFAWAGVISDDLGPNLAAINVVMNKMIGKTIRKEELREEFELPVKKFWLKYLSADYDEEAQQAMFAEAINEAGKPEIYFGIRDVLAELKSKGVNLFVLSSHPQDNLLAEAKEYGIDELFNKVYGSKRDKVEAIKEIISENGLDSKETAYVGNFTYDIDAGKEAGVLTVAFTGGYQTEERLKTANPDFVISENSELLKII